MKFEDTIANSMNQVLNSKEHASLFKKAYVEQDENEASDAAKKMQMLREIEKEREERKEEKEHALTARPKLYHGGHVEPHIEPEVEDLYADDQNNAKSGCKKCGRDENNCMCSDKNMAKDTCKTCKKNMKSCECEKEDSSESSSSESSSDDSSSSESSSSESSKRKMALNVALESLLKASAALDYSGLYKGSELTLKVASLVSEAKKGKVDLTGTREQKAKLHLRKLRELSEEESSKPKAKKSTNRGSSSSKSTKKPVAKKKVSKAQVASPNTTSETVAGAGKQDPKQFLTKVLGDLASKTIGVQKYMINNKNIFQTTWDAVNTSDSAKLSECIATLSKMMEKANVYDYEVALTKNILPKLKALVSA